MSDCTLIDRCRVHSVEGYLSEPFTDHIATSNGWMFGCRCKVVRRTATSIRQSSPSDAQADEDLQTTLGVSELSAGEYDERYAFRCYYANELISGRVGEKNGNKALFFEPLARKLDVPLHLRGAYHLRPIRCGPRRRAAAMACSSKAVREVEDVISYYYRGGSTFDSEFWRAAATSAQARLERRSEFREYLTKLAALKKKGTMFGGPPYAFSPHTWQIVDAQMGYDSFAEIPANS